MAPHWRSPAETTCDPRDLRALEHSNERRHDQHALRGLFTILADSPPIYIKCNTRARGDPALAARVGQLLAPLPVVFDDSWGLDHGTWSVLTHVYPQADIPVVQLSINETRTAAEHFEIGRRLAKLRTEEVLLLGSGNLVHNLHTYAWGQHKPQAYDWATRFENTARDLMRAQDYAPLIDYESLGRDAILSVPTPEHYLPLLYVLGARHAHDELTFPVEGVDGGSISMLSVQLSTQ